MHAKTQRLVALANSYLERSRLVLGTLLGRGDDILGQVDGAGRTFSIVLKGTKRVLLDLVICPVRN